MKISSKLLVIVLLTFFEISLTVWSVFEIAKGATFHQLNFLHLKHNETFTNEIFEIENGSALDIPRLRNMIDNIRQQPVECLQRIDLFNEFIMRQIGTSHIIDLCRQDIHFADKALHILDEYSKAGFDRSRLVAELQIASNAFTDNSVQFEEPVTKTVAFIMRTMIPLVIIISVFNILFIIFMSRNITGSINDVISLLAKTNSKETLDADINERVTGELKTLLNVAKQRLSQELLVTEVNKKLEALVEQRTFSLTRANEELAQFAYRASHDLKSPLTTTKRLAQFIKQDIQSGELDTAVNDSDKIVAQMGKLEELVVGILALAEADATEQDVIDIDFESILSNISISNNTLLTENNCKVEQDINISQPMKGSKVRMVQIIENLMTNAIKYCDPNKTQAFVKVSIFEKPNAYILIVRDNGLGIPKNRLNELFHMFKRFHPNVSTGSGLGMAIIKKHIDFMQGTIHMDTSDEGTVFTIEFPKEKLA